MEFNFISSEKVDLLNSEEIRVFVAPSKKYSCPSCEERKRKLISQFGYFSKKHEVGRIYTMAPMCENCFELKHYNELIEGFYSDIKKG